MTTVADVCEWALVKDTFRTGLLEAFGVQPDDPLRTLACIEEEDVKEVRATLALGEAKTKLNPAQKGKVVLVWRVARFAAGDDETREAKNAAADKAKTEALERDKLKLEVLKTQAAAATAVAATTAAPAGAATENATDTVSLAEVIDQTLTGKVKLMSKQSHQAAHDK